MHGENLKLVNLMFAWEAHLSRR